MANPVISPVNPHFIQPLLPGFHQSLTVPLTFFLRHIKGIREVRRTVELRSELRERSWEVKMEGRKLTDGWEEFAVTHELKVGDFLLFRHEADLVFHVTAFGPSCCQIQYTPLRPDDDIRNLRRDKKVNKNIKTEVDPSDHTCLTVAITAAALRKDTLYIPKHFARRNNMRNRDGKMILMNGQGKLWTVDLKCHKSSGRFYASHGWRGFCRKNGLKAGGFCRFKLVRKNMAGHPVLRNIPFESGYNSSSNSGESSETEEKKALGAKLGNNSNSLGKSLRTEIKKTHKRWRVPSIEREIRFVTLSLTPYSLRKSKLGLPKTFADVNGLNKSGQKIRILDRDKREWPTYLRVEKSTNRVSLGRGWREFCAANGLKKGESFTLELIWEDMTPILKFCCKVKIQQCD